MINDTLCGGDCAPFVHFHQAFVHQLLTATGMDQSAAVRFNTRINPAADIHVDPTLGLSFNLTSHPPNTDEG
ncbi:hypothetical protein HC762_00700, partial [bacterium]|nr:hypothetical protein [bacterium]